MRSIRRNTCKEIVLALKGLKEKLDYEIIIFDSEILIKQIKIIKKKKKN